MTTSFTLPDTAVLPRLPRHGARRDAAGVGRGRAPMGLIGGGALVAAGALAVFACLRCLGLLNLDTMTLLPAAACAGAGAASLGVVLACSRALRDA